MEKLDQTISVYFTAAELGALEQAVENIFIISQDPGLDNCLIAARTKIVDALAHIRDTDPDPIPPAAAIEPGVVEQVQLIDDKELRTFDVKQRRHKKDPKRGEGWILILHDPSRIGKTRIAWQSLDGRLTWFADAPHKPTILNHGRREQI